jgi:CHAD domain-containing protein
METVAGDWAEAVRYRAFEIAQSGAGASPVENWLQAEREFAVAHDYDTADRDLERLGMTLSRLPAEAGVVWRLILPRGERVEEWEPGNLGLSPPEAVTALLDAAVTGKALQPAPPLGTEPGAVRLREMLQVQRRTMLVHDPGARIGSDPENLHQHRVAARRSRAFLRATRSSLDGAWRRSLTADLRHLGAVTGPVRDLDVLLEHVEDELQSLGRGDRPAAELLVAALRREREAARARMLDVLDGDAYRRLLARLHVPPRLADGVEAVPLRRLARREFRRLVSTVDGLGADPGEEALHALRIGLKRVRYTTELAAPEGKRRRRFLAAARDLQDLLGEHQDAVTAEQHLRMLGVGTPATAVAFVAGRLAERQHARREVIRARLPAAWKRLRKSGARLG